MRNSDISYALAEEMLRQLRRLIFAWQARLTPALHSGLGKLQIADDLLADKDRGLVYSKYLKNDGDPASDFVLSVPAWLFSEKDLLRVEHSRDALAWTTLHEEFVEYHNTPIADPYPISLDKGADQMGLEGTHYFRTWIRNDADDISFSEPLELIFDRVPPYKHGPPSKFPDILVVTDASLGAAGGKAILTLPAYSDYEVGDNAFVYWMNRLPDKFEDVDPPVVTVPTTGNEQPVDIPEAAIRAVGDGGVFVLYVLVDMAGNVSEMSVYNSVAVALGTLPTVFAKPTVPLATEADDYLIDQADANTGVEVLVPLYDGMKASDFVAIKWGNTEVPAETVGSAPGDYIRLRVPNAVMLKAYGAGPGVVDTKVSYTLLRGTHPLGGADTDIKVNFETMDPGGPDPSWPLPIHPGLHKAVITGKGSGKTNELDIDDEKLNADLAFELYSFALENDVLIFYWGGEEAVTYTVKSTDTPGETINIEVPWDIILKVSNNPAVPVDYEARRASVHNPMRSAITSVNVDAVVIVPEAATFEHLVNGLVSCKSIQATKDHEDGPAVEVLIPDLSEYLKYGEFTQVALKWWVFRGRSEAEGFEVIEEVTLDETVTLDDEHPVTGFIWRVPYEKNVLPTYDGSGDVAFMRSRANVTYALKRDKGDLVSDTAKVTLAFIPPSGSCDVNG